MAAAIIPIIAAAAPLLTPLIKDLVLNAQKLFGHNQGTGATKAQTVIDAVSTVADKLSTAGQIPGQIDVASIASMVESVVQQFKATGILPSDGAPAVVAQATTTAAVAGGQFVRITGTLEVLKVITLSLRQGTSTMFFGPPEWRDEDGVAMTPTQVATRIDGKRVLVVIHGYRVKSPMGAYSQIAYEMRAEYDEVIVVLWPGSNVVLGFAFAMFRAAKAGRLLADAVAEVFRQCRIMLDIEGHSAGCKVALEALRYCGGMRPRFVILAAPAVDDESIERGEIYGGACASCKQVVIAYSRHDEVLRDAYPLGAFDHALGYNGPQNPGRCAENVVSWDLTECIMDHSQYKESPTFFRRWRALLSA